jgi:hypothetical protein
MKTTSITDMLLTVLELKKLKGNEVGSEGVYAYKGKPDDATVYGNNIGMK